MTAITVVNINTLTSCNCPFYSALLNFRNAGVPLNLNSVNQLIFVMVKCGVLFEVRTEFLNNI
jgi:hypothetical protein